MRNTTRVTAAKWLLWAQLALAIPAAGLVAFARTLVSGRVSTSGSAWMLDPASSSPLLIYCAALVIGSAIGLVAVRRGSRASRLATGLVLIAPAAFVIASVPSSRVDGTIAYVSAPDDALRMQLALTLMNWANVAVVGAMLAAAAAGVLVMLSAGRGQPVAEPTTSESAP